MTAQRRAVFLDRDGVLNVAPLRDGMPFAPDRPDQMELLPGVAEACRRLADAGWLLVIVTNQPDVARGTQTRAAVEEINRMITAAVPVDDVVVCYHDDADGCACRKPLPGMLLDAAERLDIDLSLSVMVGDRWRDVEAGQRAGARSIWVDRSYSERAPERPDHVVAGLPEAVEIILGAEGPT